jgi:multidrug resistance protein
MNARRALVFILCTVTLDMLGLGLIIPVLPKIVLGFMGGDTASAAEVFGLFATVWGLMQFFCSPLLGALSDRFGRRPVILVSCLGMGLDYVFMAVAPSLTLLFIGRVVSGITAATVSTSFAYIADVTEPKARAKAFGLIGMGFSLGFILGPAIGGLLGGLDERLPFWVAAGACFLNVAFGWFVLPESLPADRRMAFSWKRANPIGALRLLASHIELLGLSAVNFLGQLAHQVLPSVFVLYAGYRYGWGETAVGLTLAFVGACSGVAQGLLVGPAGRAVDLASWPAVRGHRNGDLRPGADRSAVPGRGSCHGAVGAFRTCHPRDHDAIGQPVRTGSAAGRQYVPRQHRGPDRPGALHAVLCLLHRPKARRPRDSGSRFRSRRPDPVGRARHRLGDDTRD